MKQVQKVFRDHGTYDVNKLWNKTKNIKTNKIDLDKIIHNLDIDLWTTFVNGKEKYITPKQVIKNPYVSPQDFCKIINADLSYPIIIYEDNGYLDVLDGLHRLAKSVILKRKTIKVKYVSNDILLKCKIKQ